MGSCPRASNALEVRDLTKASDTCRSYVSPATVAATSVSVCGWVQ